MKIFTSDFELEHLEKQYRYIPAYTRKKHLYTFETYVNSRLCGWSHKQIREYFKLSEVK